MQICQRAVSPVPTVIEDFPHLQIGRATKGLGGIVPSGWKDVAEMTGNDELKGVVMPVGKFDDGNRRSLWYNEVRFLRVSFSSRRPLTNQPLFQYIVYDTTQIRLRYLLRVSFKR